MLAAARLTKLSPAARSVPGTLDFMARVSPHLTRPDHFAAYAAALDTSVGAGHRIVFSAPPQHGKSETTLHGLTRTILAHPERRHAYVTYAQDRARSVARKVRRILESAGVTVEGTLDMMRFPSLHPDAQLKFTSIDGGITGEPVDGLAVVDDPIKNRAEADSPRRRQVIDEAFREAILTRVHPGASVVVLATRWHPEDLSGTLIREGWETINLPALAEEGDTLGRDVGEPLFPSMWPVEALEEKRAAVGEHTWSALYQGRPRIRGGSVYRAATYYSALPTAYRGAYGVDLAYTAKSSADWSVCVEVWREDTETGPRFYIVNVDRARTDAPTFAATLRARHESRPGWPMLWRASGTEKGSAQFLRASGVPIKVEQPPGDKLVSATESAALWNQGRVLVPDPHAFPEASAWLSDFLETVEGFTGTGREHDDDVDALGNGIMALRSASLVDAMDAVARRGGRVFL